LWHTNKKGILYEEFKSQSPGIMLGFIGAGVAGGLTIHTIAKLLGPDLTVNVLIGSVLVFLLYQVYGLVLARLESEARM
jgi:hypothetical protein